ncbi:dihydrodipicolinate synthase family protein [Allostreptomyces psammosilenae]|uniref:4-hydroxy-tetrahydrodipicolinate synthase n=1 Tax=Allostreptomyces psammosilenae TaxID=1892865 RepID=A0A853A2S8_9ACTN|nr:dihydrodipicolinate synthase family protein [Allostreptomyces psammosilenae]NYI04768.1 4-hydroxy-tetrahydrodipicolinate synthase [Allostreptomyces psammosilenae]
MAHAHGTPLGGVHVPLVTPFTADGGVALDALEGLAHRVIDDGAAGLVALGTTAEAATLDADEKRAVVDLCATVCRERSVALVVGTGSNDTRHTLEALRELTRWPGATAALVPVPYFTRPSEAGVVAHFTRLAAETPLPLVVYNIPHRTGRTLAAPALRELAALPAIIGVKHAVAGVDEDTLDLLGSPIDGFAVLAGDDLFASPMLALGAAGGILATAQLAPRHFVTLESAWRAGDVPRARPLGHSLAALAAAAFAEPNPTVLKGVLHARGQIPTPTVRLPLLPAHPESVEAALRRLEELDS